MLSLCSTKRIHTLHLKCNMGTVFPSRWHGERFGWGCNQSNKGGQRVCGKIGGGRHESVVILVALRNKPKQVDTPQQTHIQQEIALVAPKWAMPMSLQALPYHRKWHEKTICQKQSVIQALQNRSRHTHGRETSKV